MCRECRVETVLTSLEKIEQISGGSDVGRILPMDCLRHYVKS